MPPLSASQAQHPEPTLGRPPRQLELVSPSASTRATATCHGKVDVCRSSEADASSTASVKSAEGVLPGRASHNVSKSPAGVGKGTTTPISPPSSPTTCAAAASAEGAGAKGGPVMSPELAAAAFGIDNEAAQRGIEAGQQESGIPPQAGIHHEEKVRRCGQCFGVFDRL